MESRHFPCFLINGRRMILPALSLDARGGHVLRSGDRDPTGRAVTDWQAVAIVGNQLVAAQRTQRAVCRFALPDRTCFTAPSVWCQA
jgi:hypothetical protein